MLGTLWFQYVTAWWSMKEEPIVLLLHYADARKDFPGTVKKLAKFMEVDLTSDEVTKVAGKCDILYMKAIREKFDYSMPLNQDPFWDNEKMRLLKRGQMIGTGKVGHSQEQPFTEEHREKWRKAEEEVLGSIDPNLLRWAREGGAFDGSSVMA